jgi:hypothetical protein
MTTEDARAIALAVSQAAKILERLDSKNKK